MTNLVNAKVYNWEGNIVGELALPDVVFGRKVVPTLVHSVMVATRGNSRVAIAHVKHRGEVRGGGKKPWKQKGTGRARHGSIRSPIWIGGGVVGGPRSDRNFSVKINRKVKQLALAMALSDKAANTHLVVLEGTELPAAKTKIVAAMLAKLPHTKNNLLVLPASNPTVLRAARNIPNLHTITMQSLSLLDVLGNGTVIMPKATVAALAERYAKA